MRDVVAPALAAASDGGVLNDAAVVEVAGARLAFTTDSFVVSPIGFPGGDIGSLAVHGTVNDLAMCGARPLALSCGLILEEGLAMATLWRVVTSLRDAAAQVGVPIATGDTKVVGRAPRTGCSSTPRASGSCRTALGLRPTGRGRGRRAAVEADPGHGVAIMSVREGLEFEVEIASDTQALTGLVAAMLEVEPDVHVLRDPTRGGLSSALNEIAAVSRVGMVLDEPAIPVPGPVRAACELLGLDPLHVANEGKLVAIVPAGGADAVLAAMRARPEGAEAARIGEVVADHPGMVTIRTIVGSERIVDMLVGEQLPRIC
jgi:hydrogenase expression/formation protein HypE